MVKFVSISPPRGYHFMKKKGGTYALMKGNYKPHKGAVKKAKFRLQKQHRGWGDLNKRPIRKRRNVKKKKKKKRSKR